MSSLRDEIQRRILRKRIGDDRNNIIGVEIKSRRKKQAITLEALSNDVCSQSYLCKIETNKIAPNREFLREICERLELTGEKLDNLFMLKDIILGVVKALIKNDIEFINEAYEDGEGLENYRFSIVKLAYYLANKKIGQAEAVYEELQEVTRSMPDFDLGVFAVLSSLLSYYKADFMETIDVLSVIDESDVPREISMLKNMIDFKTRIAINSHEAPYYYEKVKRDLYDYGYYNQYEENLYLIGLYFARNKCESAFNETMSRMNNSINITSLKCIKDFYDDDITTLIEANNSMLNEFTKTMKFVIARQYDNKNEIDADCDFYRVDYNSLLLQYLLCEDYKEKVDFIFKNGIPMATMSNNNFMKNYFINELMKMPIGIGKSRNIGKAYVMAYGSGKIVLESGE